MQFTFMSINYHVYQRLMVSLAEFNNLGSCESLVENYFNAKSNLGVAEAVGLIWPNTVVSSISSV